MLNPDLGPLARITAMLAAFVPATGIGATVWAGARHLGAPDIVAAFPAGLVAIAGIITITHGIETLIQRQAAANQQ
jgi:hypothetical protein